MNMKIRKNSDNIHLVELRGELNMNSSIQLKDLIMNMIRDKIEQYIISLKEVDGISSEGVGALIYISSTLKKLNYPLVILATEGPVLHALEVSRLKGYFTIAASLKEALAVRGAAKN